MLPIPTPADAGSAGSAVASIPFSRMTFFGKVIHVLKIIVFFLTAGFAYPNILIG